MKKVLILAYDFPPYVSVGGLRPYSWYKYLNEFGIYPVVVTRQWNNKYGSHLDYVAPGSSKQTVVVETEFGTIIQSPYKPNLSNRLLLKYGEKRFVLVRKSISAWLEFVQWYLPFGAKYGLYKASKQFLKTNKVDCIIATGDPFILFRYADLLSRKFKIPWIADYRDPWLQDKTRNRNKLLLYIEGQIEKKLIKNAALVVTVSDFVNLLINAVHKKKFAIIPNGYNSIPDVSKQETKKFTIAFVGTIYNWHPLKVFLSVCNTLYKEKGMDIQIQFIGLNDINAVLELVDEQFIEMKKSIEFISKLDNLEFISKIASANLLLLFNDYSILGTKIFDYLAVKRQILLCFSNDPEANKLKEKYYKLPEFEHISNHLQQDLIIETNSGIVVENEKHLYGVLEELYKEFKDFGFIKCNSHGIEKYSRKKQTEKLAEIIKRVVEEHKQRRL